MYKELQDDLGLYIPNNGFLEKWAKQGVLLLNTTLTVRDSEANSHSKIGWQTFTDNIIKKLNEREKPVIFILWGNNAKAKEKFIDTNKHYILKGLCFIKTPGRGEPAHEHEPTPGRMHFPV